MASPRSLQMLKPVTVPGTISHVLAQLREAIILAQLQPGDRLVEAEIANQLGVSRAPVREALRVLSREHLVTVRPNRGAVVSTVTEDDVREVYALKDALCEIALERLIPGNRVTPELVEDLESMAAEYRTTSRRDRDIHSKLDRAMQIAIVEASGLPRVSAQFTELCSEAWRFVYLLDIRYPHIEQMWDKLDELVAAIGARDLKKSKSVWREINQRSVEEYLEKIS